MFVVYLFYTEAGFSRESFRNLIRKTHMKEQRSVDAVIYAITRPRHITIASLVIDSDSQGMDFRSHLEK